MVKTFQGACPIIDKYENHKKRICRLFAEHVFLCNHFIFFRKGHFYQAMPADLRWDRSPPPTPELVEENTKMNLVFPIWETSCFPFGKQVTHFLLKFLFAKWKSCKFKMFSIRDKTLSSISQMVTQRQTGSPMVKTFQGVFPVMDKYENHKKCICHPIAKHLRCFLLRKKTFLLFPKWGESYRHAALW